MHKLSSSFVLAYHGCDRAIGERLLAGEKFKRSENPYDWLGWGTYFWENDPDRGLDFVRELSKIKRFKKKYPNPYVIGAVIELGFCLDLTTQKSIRWVETAYKSLIENTDIKALLENKEPYLRPLDCAVINRLHTLIEKTKGEIPSIDTIKGMFREGECLYPTSGFYEKTHVQICVRNPVCIKGVFRVTQ